MSNAALSHTSPQSAPLLSGGALVTAAALGLWLALVVVLGMRESFVAPPGAPPVPILVAVTIPVIAFLAALRLSGRLRELALTADLRLVTALQAWRFAGLGFLALYAHNVLPGDFALPAGLGDMAIGVSAPFLVIALIRRPHVAASGLS